MELSLQEAVAMLGKTRRQVLYLIAQGRLPAKKIGGRWVIERADLQVDEERQQRASQQQARFKAVVEEALTSGPGRRYTLRDLKAIQLATRRTPTLFSSGCGWPWKPPCSMTARASTRCAWPMTSAVSSAAGKRVCRADPNPAL